MEVPQGALGEAHTEAEDADAPKSRGMLGMAIQGGLAVLVSILALWWAFHDVDLDEMGDKLRGSSAVVLVLYGLGQLAIHFLRIIRWGIYIRPLAPEVSARAVFSAGNIGIAATFFIPLRLGEFVRPMLITRAGLPFGSAVASVVVERVADGLCAVGMYFIFFSFIPDFTKLDPKVVAASTGASFAFGGALLFLVAAAFAREPVLGLTSAILGRISTTFADRIVGLIGTFLDGLAALGSLWRATSYAALTIAYWFGNGLLTWYLAASYAPDLPVTAGLFTIAVLVFAVMIPAGPGFTGTFEFGVVKGLMAFGVAKPPALVVALAAHVIQLLMMGVLVGMGFMAAEPKQRQKPEAAEI